MKNEQGANVSREDQDRVARSASAVTSPHADGGTGQYHATRLAHPVSLRDHSRGPEAAPVTLVEYGDFECPYCGAAAAVVRQLQERFGPDLRFVFRANPRSHVFPHAEKAAEAAEAAAVQGKFWEMHDLLFANQGALEDKDLVEYARRLGLDVDRFQAELQSGAHQGRVHDQEVGGWPSHVISTPTFFVNGVRFDDRPDLDGLGAALAAAREAAQRK
jgi:protein-disulfide isomerase